MQHLAERLEKRRNILEFRRLQELQNKEEMVEEVKAFEEPLINNLIKDGKLTEKQKDEILNEHEKNLQNLQKQQEIGKLYNILHFPVTVFLFSRYFIKTTNYVDLDSQFFLAL